MWSIPPGRMKTNDAFSVPLSERALAIIAEARRMARKEPTPDSFVFLGARPRQPLSSMALAMLMRRMDVDATAHGLASAHGHQLPRDCEDRGRAIHRGVVLTTRLGLDSAASGAGGRRDGVGWWFLRPSPETTTRRAGDERELQRVIPLSAGKTQASQLTSRPKSS